MRTALAAQLAQIRAKSSNPLDLKAQRKAHSKSLLFDPSHAANQDFDMIYQLCYEGFFELCQLDPRFIPFGKNLFGEQSKHEDRTQMTEAQNGQLDALVEDFLALVGSRLLLKPALLAVEWVVRRFRQVTTCDVLMWRLTKRTWQDSRAQHDTLCRDFPTLPLASYVHDDAGHITYEYSASVEISVPAFFAALNAYVLRVCRLGFHYAALFSFWASVVTEATAGMIDLARSGRQEAQRQNQEDVIMRLMPVLNDALMLDGIPDLRIGCYMMVTVLASKAVLSDKALTALMDAVVLRWAGTTHAGLICLAVLAQRRDSAKLPRGTFKALMSMDNIEDDLTVLKSQYRVDKLVLGLVLRITAKLRKDPSATLIAKLRAVCLGDLMDASSMKASIHAFEILFKEPKRFQAFDLVDSLSDLILRLAVTDTVGPVVRKMVMESKEAPKFLQQQLQMLDTDHHAEQLADKQDVLKEDQEQPVETFDEAMKRIQPLGIHQTSFLLDFESYDFSNLIHTFILATDSPNDIERFANLPILRRSQALKEPLFLSFFIRAWVGLFPVKTRVAAIDMISEQLKEGDLSSDVQMLLPYILYALTDSSRQIRQSSSKLALLLAKAYRKAKEALEVDPDLPTLEDIQIYGKTEEASDLTWLSLDETVKLLEDFLVPNLEEALLDANHIIKYFANVMNINAAQDPRKHDRKDFKSSWKRSIFVFLCKHVIKTPSLRVKNRLLGMLNQVPKVGGVSRTKALLPLLTTCTGEHEDVLLEKCKQEQIEPEQFLRQLLGIITPTDKDGMHALEELVEHESMLKGPHFYAASLDYTRTMWPSMKHDSKQLLAEKLLESVFASPGVRPETTPGDEAIGILRYVELSTSTLSGFLKRLPSLNNAVKDGVPTAKRRKTGHGQEVKRADPEAIDDSLRKFTIVLELIDSCGSERHPELLEGLFTVLADLESYQRRTGTELGYLEVTVLNNACRIIDSLARTPGSQVDHSAVNSEVLIGCISLTESPQVQQAALLLVASIASVAPELILHSIMPIFTFMGAGIMRANDDYSLHVVKKTMDSVIPRLMRSLHERKEHAIIGVSELLLNFVAAYKDIPSQRRQDLFDSLTEKIGAKDYLFALMLLFADKYPGRKTILDFATGLVARQVVGTQLAVIEQSLDVVNDSLSSKPALSAHLLNNETLKSADEKISNILPLISSLLKDPRLRRKSEKVLSQGKEGMSTTRSSFARIFEQILSLRDKIGNKTQVAALCDDVLHAFLSLLSLEGFVGTLPELFERTPAHLHAHALESLETRLLNAKNEKPSARDACLMLLPRLTKIIEENSEVRLQRAAVLCTDQIVEKFGKKDIDTVSSAATIISGPRCLGVADNSIRITALLCLATMVEAAGEAIIHITPQAMPLVMDHLAASQDEDAEDHRLHDASYAFVTSLLLYVPWIVAGPYLDQVLKISYESANAEMGEECDKTRMEALRLLAKTLEPKDCFAALDRTWTNAMAEGPLAVKEHLVTLQLAIETRSKSKIAKHSDALADLFLKIFDLRRIQFSPRTDDSYEDAEVEEVEAAINSTLITMIYKLNDAVFRPIFTRFLEWSAGSTLKNPKSKIHRQTTIWTFLLSFFSTLKSIVTNYAGLIIDDAVDILTNISPKEVDSRVLWERVILTLQSAFEHDQDDFFQSPTHYPPLCNALLAQLPAVASSATLLPQLISTITLLANTTVAPAQHKSLCSPLLQYLRDDSAAVRLAAVKTQLSLTERLGEEWLAQLPEMLPFVGEGMEDDDEEVEMEVRRWVKRIEEILGESISPMLQ